MFVMLVLSSCGQNQENNKSVSQNRFLLGTIITVQIYDKASDKLFDEIFNRLKEIENKMTINEKNSEIMLVNSNAGTKFTKVSDDTFYVVEKGKYFSELSGGRFDISIGPLVKLWNIGTEGAEIPDRRQIEEKKSLVDYNGVLLNSEKKSIMLKKTGMMLDLGGIAKGYAADEVAKILKENNIKHAIINLGGNVLAYGSKPDGSEWRIGIQNPFSSRGDYVGIVNVINKQVVTSGIYERYFEAKGKIYHHILDPETGYPVENNLVSVTVIADKGIDADSLSTSAFAMGLENGFNLIEGLDNTEAVFITNDSKIYLTSGLKETFKLTDRSFSICDTAGFAK
ncbi:MAG: FAD:protein FMN transferase [Firmicutes bacterium]|nr:FAD:protein FMN transferase [Bacillota bacterium]